MYGLIVGFLIDVGKRFLGTSDALFSASLRPLAGRTQVRLVLGVVRLFRVKKNPEPSGF
jgi:hypothetical protein